MRAFFIVALLAMLPLVAHAADCPPLQIVNQMAITRLSNGTATVPVTINGEDTGFVLSTGSITTQISRAYVDAHKLTLRATNKKLFDLRGNSSDDEASIHQLKLGVMQGNDVFLPVFPSPLPQSGLLSLNYLLPFDADIDFGAGTLKFFSQDHCPGNVLYWNPAAVAAVPIKVANGHIIATVTINDRKFDAIIDTGAGQTILSTGVAKNFLGLRLGSADTPLNENTGALDAIPIYTTALSPGLNDPEPPKLYGHTFSSIAFGDIAVNNAHTAIIPISGGIGAGVIVGMDVLRKLHVYFAFKEGKMYVSAAAAPAPDSTTTPPVPAK